MFRPNQCSCLVFLGMALFSHSAYLHFGVWHRAIRSLIPRLSLVQFWPSLSRNSMGESVVLHDGERERERERATTGQRLSLTFKTTTKVMSKLS